MKGTDYGFKEYLAWCTRAGDAVKREEVEDAIMWSIKKKRGPDLLRDLDVISTADEHYVRGAKARSDTSFPNNYTLFQSEAEHVHSRISLYWVKFTILRAEWRKNLFKDKKGVKEFEKATLLDMMGSPKGLKPSEWYFSVSYREVGDGLALAEVSQGDDYQEVVFEPFKGGVNGIVPQSFPFIHPSEGYTISKREDSIWTATKSLEKTVCTVTFPGAIPTSQIEQMLALAADTNTDWIHLQDRLSLVRVSYKGI